MQRLNFSFEIEFASVMMTPPPERPQTAGHRLVGCQPAGAGETSSATAGTVFSGVAGTVIAG